MFRNKILFLCFKKRFIRLVNFVHAPCAFNAIYYHIYFIQAFWKYSFFIIQTKILQQILALYTLNALIKKKLRTVYTLVKPHGQSDSVDAMLYINIVA
jgi:hypothetical protein